MTEADISDISAALEIALRTLPRGATAAAEEFRKVLVQRNRARHADPHADLLSRFRQGSWKRDTLEFALKLLAHSQTGTFRYSDFAQFETQLRERHPDQRSTMSGLNVTLQTLVKDGILRQPQRGYYQLA